jgi:hypothetical protein
MRQYIVILFLFTLSLANAAITYEIDGTETTMDGIVTIDRLIEKSGSTYYFILNDVSMGDDIELILPESAILTKDKIISPVETTIGTNGRQVIITWDNIQSNKIIVLYELPGNGSNYPYYLGVLVLLGGILYYVYFKKTIKIKKLTQNLLVDEKRIVKYLAGKKGREAWTGSISKDLGISKVRLSRKIRSLGAKELIQKVPYGNKNKIKLR